MGAVMGLQDKSDKQTLILKEVMEELGKADKACLIGIDGRDRTGKSSFGNTLGTELGIPTIDTDLYFDKDDKRDYRSKELRWVLDVRLNAGLMVIVEGIFLLRTLHEIGLEPNYLIYVVNEEQEAGEVRDMQFATYEKEYRPREKANKVLCR